MILNKYSFFIKFVKLTYRVYTLDIDYRYYNDPLRINMIYYSLF